MRWNRRAAGRRGFGIVLLSLLLFCGCFDAAATPITEAEREKTEAEEKKSAAEKAAADYEKERDSAASETKNLGIELTGLLTEIELLEDDMEAMEGQIEKADEEYQKAKKDQERQYELLKKRIQYVYEEGDITYLDILLKAKSIGDMISQTEYFEQLYEYDKNLISNYEKTKAEVLNRRERLEERKSEMDVMKQEYSSRKAELQTAIGVKKQEVSDFDKKLADAKRESAAMAEMIRKKNEEIRLLQAQEERRREQERIKREREAAQRAAEEREAAERAAAEGETAKGETAKRDEGQGTGGQPQSGGQTPSLKSAGGSSFGREVADYALQFVGNPYVYGGTSLTNGADCSGYVQSVYRHFGINIPRTSAQQANFGKEISYGEMEPGDLVCYAGHVAMYIGDGRIVHASSAKSGIKVSDNPAYRTIVSIRRPW